MRAALILALLAILPAVPGCGARRGSAPGPTQTVRISCRGHDLIAEIAADEPTRERGLMYRRSLDRDAGMLFVFPADTHASFWMKDTYIPLTIAFIDAGGQIVNLSDMEPFDDRSNHRSARPVRYALEMNRGWFAEHGVGPGDTCDLRDVEVR
jgi:uncharacterized protein